MSLETLAYYDIPYEIDRNNPDRIIILREMDKYATEVLFEHTRRLRGGLPRRRSSYDDMRDYNLRSESHVDGSPFVVNTYHEGTSSGYDEVGARTRDRSSGYQPHSSIRYQPSTSNSYRRAAYAPSSAADPSRNPYAEQEYDGLHTYHSMNRRRSPSPSAYTDGRRGQSYSQRSYGANDVHTEVGSAFPDKQLIVRESDSAERWNPRQFSRDDGCGLSVANEIYDDRDGRSRDLEAKVKEEKEIEERRQKTQVEADVLRTIRDFKERESSFKGDTKVTAKRLAALALQSRSRSRSRSKAPSISSASVAERRSPQPPTKSTRLPTESVRPYTREEVSDDSISDVYPDSEDSEDSSTESSESDVESDRRQGPATSGGTSELGFDRTIRPFPFRAETATKMNTWTQGHCRQAGVAPVIFVE
ncbi:hypothetical protein KC343_g10127 [Hortaea werneckii]|nr:hypothetical protein KC343_g10127 [Hortaea werneckii]